MHTCHNASSKPVTDKRYYYYDGSGTHLHKTHRAFEPKHPGQYPSDEQHHGSVEDNVQAGQKVRFVLSENDIPDDSCLGNLVLHC